VIEVLAVGASGRITSRVERFRLDEVDEAYRRLVGRPIRRRRAVRASSAQPSNTK
jgi:D-arabinose 1-dehydrogenase-like Zn-dependent alcohol dehydrogenase